MSWVCCNVDKDQHQVPNWGASNWGASCLDPWDSGRIDRVRELADTITEDLHARQSDHGGNQDTRKRVQRGQSSTRRQDATYIATTQGFTCKSSLAQLRRPCILRHFARAWQSLTKCHNRRDGITAVVPSVGNQDGAVMLQPYTRSLLLSHQHIAHQGQVSEAGYPPTRARSIQKPTWYRSSLTMMEARAAPTAHRVGAAARPSTMCPPRTAEPHHHIDIQVSTDSPPHQGVVACKGIVPVHEATLPKAPRLMECCSLS